jgi:hypothetical protein
MGRVIGFLLGVLAIWATVEIYVNGTDGAFGGRLARYGVVEEGATQAPATERARAAVEAAHTAQQDRYEDLLPE